MAWLIITAAIALTVLMFACIWVISDADDYSEERRNDE